VVSTPLKGGASASSARLVRKGMPPLSDHVALFPKPAPSWLMTEERKAAWCERSRCRAGAMLRAKGEKRGGTCGGTGGGGKRGGAGCECVPCVSLWSCRDAVRGRAV
jgi:hypothetical protein